MSKIAIHFSEEELLKTFILFIKNGNDELILRFLTFINVSKQFIQGALFVLIKYKKLNDIETLKRIIFDLHEIKYKFSEQKEDINYNKISLDKKRKNNYNLWDNEYSYYEESKYHKKNKYYQENSYDDFIA